MNAFDRHLLAGVPLAPGLRLHVTAAEHGEADDVARAARGDTAAFERLYHLHYQRVARLARRMVGADHADDATQDVFFRAWRTLSTYRADAAFSTWLYRLAVNVLLRRLERIRGDAARTTQMIGDSIPAPLPSADARLDIDRALAALPIDLRAAVVLHDIEGYSHEEMGYLLNISLTAARMRLYRARLALRAFAEGR